MLLEDVYVPTTNHSTEDVRRVLRDCEEISRSSAVRRFEPGSATAKGGPTPPDAAEVFFDHVLEKMVELEVPRAEAIRLTTIEKPHLAEAYRAEHNKEASVREADERKTKTRDRAGRNR